MDSRDDRIHICHANEHNLKDVTISLPKGQITVFTGVSGSGKSSLCLDTIAAESRRELNETFPSFVQQYLPKYGRPDVERVENLPVTIIIDQKKPTANARSTVGTYTDIYALLRLLYARCGEPFVGYSDVFSFNHPAGRCPRCDGLGEVTELDLYKLVDFDKCLNDEGVIRFPTFTTGAWRWKRYAWSGLFDLDKKIRDYSEEELRLFLYQPQMKLKDPPPQWPKSAKYEGLWPRMYRSIIPTKEGKRQKKVLDGMTSVFTCPDCGGTRLGEKVRACKIAGRSITDVAAMPIPRAREFIASIDHPLAGELKRELTRRLLALEEIGLGYLSLDRGTGTLSGGEAQRIKIAKSIHSALADVAYVLDEPSVGLHPQDIQLMRRSLTRLRDQGNTILIVEHHREVIALADHVVDMGPGPGARGGRVLYQGDYPGLLKTDGLTGRLLREKKPLRAPLREPEGWYGLEGVSLHNLKNVSLRLPLGVLAVVCGVAGSGKSSLMEAFCGAYPDQITAVRQKDIGISLRSTPATYLNILDDIRTIFARASGQSRSLFSFNAAGACPACGGKGVIRSDMAFMDAIEAECELCHGKRYSAEALEHTYNGKTIAQVLDLTVEEAAAFFAGEGFAPRLRSLMEVGLGYLHLNQSLSTLSGGELQRVKLASFLDRESGVFVLDEPTDGLHLGDVGNLIRVFHGMVEAGCSLFVVTHSLEVIKEADYLIELGPGGGLDGGEVLYTGPPAGMLDCPRSVTGPHLQKSL